jgi:phi13 family phage major tail protein
MAIVNVSKLYYALLDKDEKGVGGLLYKTPKYLQGVREFKATAKTSTDKLYAEGKLWEQVSSFDEVEISLDIADLTNEQYAILLGHKVANEGGVFASDSDEPPYLALLVEMEKSNGEKSYRVYYKGKFVEPSDEAKTKEGKVDFKTKSISASFQTLRHNGEWKYQVDSDDVGCPADISTKFFANVIVPTEKVEVIPEG